MTKYKLTRGDKTMYLTITPWLADWHSRNGWPVEFAE